MKKILFLGLVAVILSPLILKGEKIPTGYNSWGISESPGKKVLEFGGNPSNYWDGAKWTAIDPRFREATHGFASTSNRHYVHIDTLSDIVRYAMTGRDGMVYVMRTRIGPLFLLNQVSQDTICLYVPNLSGYRMSGDTVSLRDIYPGVNCLIINLPDGLVHKFVFSARADTMIHRAWIKAGADPETYTVNAFAIFPDRPGLILNDEAGMFDGCSGHIVRGGITLSARKNERLFAMPSGTLRQDTLTSPLWRKIVKANDQSWLYEGFRNIDIAAWPRLGYSHCDSRIWNIPAQDTYISATSPGTSYFSSAIIGTYRDAGLGARQRALLWYRGLIDSLGKAGSIDSALLQLHYTGGVIGQGMARLCRGITDSSWYNSARATWNARYKYGGDSLSWAGGWAVHTSSYTTNNSVTLSLADTNSAGWYQFSCKGLIEDIISDGVDWGFWLDNGPESNSQRVYFDSADDTGGDYPRLYIEYGGAAPVSGSIRRRRMED